ncbi:MAG TPA: (2Fe-2S)-binding protein [Roseiarcus sp.]|jgi:carbon-monoxide dehydrogenase small subunit|nr:(2Fe-2S)-binding protein [Roseiarcus sp.]
MRTPVQFSLNGEDVATFVEGGANLLDTLRETVGDLTVKGGCWQGTCGACTVLIDGAPRLACVTLAEASSGRSIETVAGLRRGAELHPLQTAFVERFAAQCGYCTPGMLMAAKALLDRNPAPSREEVVDAICGNICRCTGYEPIIEAILDASRSNSRRSA